MLVEMAQQRNEPIPALLYNSSVIAGMANGDGYERFDGGSYVVSVSEDENDDDREERRESRREEKREQLDDDVQEGKGKEKKKKEKEESLEDWEEEERRSVKLGLGDFVFYSVLVGRAALYDIVTVFTCFIGIVAGLFATLVLLTIYRQVYGVFLFVLNLFSSHSLALQALPALPISIALAMLFFFATRVFVIPFVAILGVDSVLI